MEGPVEGEGEVSDIIASNIALGYHDDSAGSLVDSELLANYLSCLVRLAVWRVEVGVAVDDHVLYLENGWDARRQGDDPDYEYGLVTPNDKPG